MTATSAESTKPSTDTTNVLPLLSEAKAPVTVSLTIDRSVKTAAGWLIGALMFATAASAVSFCYAKFAFDKAIQAETEMGILNDWLASHGVEKREDGKYYFRQEKLDGE